MTAARTGHQEALPGTVYWTLSLYIPAAELAQALGLKQPMVTPEQWRRLAYSHRCSLVLGGAMDPLFNDIADRDVHGMAQEFLIAATDDPAGEDSGDPMRAARQTVLDELTVLFSPPDAVTWETEGRQYEATPPGLGRERSATVKRFWFAHYGGALSYHLSFCYRYREDEADDLEAPFEGGYDPANFYFLSMLQKLVAPKEFTLPIERLQQPSREESWEKVSIFDADTGIPLLDHPIIEGLSPRSTGRTRFWDGLADRFNADAERLMSRLEASEPEMFARLPREDVDWRASLLVDQPVIEVPGLGMPRSRFMFFFHDPRFFNRLMPVDDAGAALERKQMVREDCYVPYTNAIKALRREHPAGTVPMGNDYWRWVTGEEEFPGEIGQKEYSSNVIRPDREGNGRFADNIEMRSAIRSGSCFRTHGIGGEELASPERLHIPAFELGRADCLDYLFLSGFNQNIIDFMNQDTSEILDSTDPLYPESNTQADERFFVRYANHRALLTYVPSSRSLEIGNDYIGTCPYAFLIHVLALHNEFLDRLHDAQTTQRIEQVETILEAVRVWGKVQSQAKPNWPAKYALPSPLKQAPLFERLGGRNEKDSSASVDDPIALEEARRVAAEWALLIRRLKQAELFGPLGGTIGKDGSATIDDQAALDEGERRINAAKLAYYQDYQRFRYLNPFRYDTERAVFERLEKLRGTSRKQHALSAALANLEDHASDLARREREVRRLKEEANARSEAAYERRVSIGLGLVGISGFLQVLYALLLFRIDRLGARSATNTQAAEQPWLNAAEKSLMRWEGVFTVFAIVLTTGILFYLVLQWVSRKHRA